MRPGLRAAPTGDAPPKLPHHPAPQPISQHQRTDLISRIEQQRRTQAEPVAPLGATWAGPGNAAASASPTARTRPGAAPEVSAADCVTTSGTVFA
jgi:hypothetical protein